MKTSHLLVQKSFEYLIKTNLLRVFIAFDALKLQCEKRKQRYFLKEGPFGSSNTLSVFFGESWHRISRIFMKLCSLGRFQCNILKGDEKPKSCYWKILRVRNFPVGCLRKNCSKCFPRRVFGKWRINFTRCFLALSINWRCQTTFDRQNVFWMK